MSMSETRIGSIDSLKGWGVTLLVFLHCGLYNFANLRSIDFENPPIYVMILGLMVLWGGLFGLASGLVNTYRFDRRRLNPPERIHRPARRLFAVGLAIYLLHLAYVLLTAPTSLDFETWNHQYSFIAQLFRFGSIHFSPRRFVQGTALQMIGINLMLLSVLLPILARSRRPSLWALVVAALFMASGVGRIYLEPTYVRLLEDGRYVGAFLLSPLTSEPYPVTPYFAFACVGAALGFRFSRTESLPRLGWLGGLGVLIVGVVGIVVFPTNLHGSGMFWLSKVTFELGVFVLISWALLARAGFNPVAPRAVQRVSRMSLTVFVLQTPLAEGLAAALTRLAPGWNATLGVTLIFAAVNVAIWLGIVTLWSRVGYKYTLEYAWVRLFPGSTKLDDID